MIMIRRSTVWKLAVAWRLIRARAGDNSPERTVWLCVSDLQIKCLAFAYLFIVGGRALKRHIAAASARYA
jgi:hypothetical protein